MAWFRRPTHPHLSDELAAELRCVHPEAGKVHAVGVGPRVLVAACTECLAVRREGQDPAWQFIGWHLVSHGGWSQERGRLKWVFVDGEGDEVLLDDPGRVPEVFRDRVQASIVVEQHYDAPGGGQVVIAGRRRLAGRDEPIVWQATTVGKARLSDPEVAQLVVQQTAALRADFDL